MQYRHFAQAGWPIGSGVVESANKVVVQARLKGAGMHWERSHVNPMLGLRNVVCNDRWAEAWPQIGARLRDQRQKRREERVRVQRSDALTLITTVNSTPTLVPTPVPIPVPSSALSLSTPSLHSQSKPTSPPAQHGHYDEEEQQQQQDLPKLPWRPPANHPWRRSPVGRARFQTTKAS